MKQLLITIIVLVLLIITNQSLAGEGDWSYEIDSMIKNKYISPDGFNIHNDWVSQTGIKAIHDSSDIYVKFWYNGDLGANFLDMDNSAGMGFETESNYILGKLFQVWGLDGDVSVAFWDLGTQGELKNDGSIDLFFTNLKLGKTFEINPHQAITLYSQVSNYTLLNSSQGNGWDYRLGLSHDLNLSKGLGWSLGGDYGFDDGYIFGDPGFNGKASTSLSWKLPPCFGFGENTTLILPEATYFFSSPRVGDQKDVWAFGGGVSIKF